MKTFCIICAFIVLGQCLFFIGLVMVKSAKDRIYGLTVCSGILIYMILTILKYIIF